METQYELLAKDLEISKYRDKDLLFILTQPILNEYKQHINYQTYSVMGSNKQIAYQGTERTEFRIQPLSVAYDQSFFDWFKNDFNGKEPFVSSKKRFCEQCGHKVEI